jgi:hypothetical protein
MPLCHSSSGMKPSKLPIFSLTICLLLSLITHHPLRNSLLPNLRTRSFVPLGVLASLTFAHTPITSLHSGRNNVCSSAIAPIIRDTSVYVPCDVVFDESIFPFVALHSIAGARLRYEISLLPSSLLDSTSYEGRSLDIGHVPKSTNASLKHCTLQDSSQVDCVEDRSVLLPRSSYFQENATE